MSADFNEQTTEALLKYLIRLGDDRMILGHRLSEWCGYGPVLEEDIALSNIALDCLGQANNFYQLAGNFDEKNRTPDDFAFSRNEREYCNLMLVEQPNGDFALTMARQFLFDAYSHVLLEGLLNSKYDELAGVAGKAVKESRYHLRHSSEWILRLGDGTEESHQRVQDAFEELWTYTGEIFQEDEVEQYLVEAGIIPSLKEIQPKWEEKVQAILNEATLASPNPGQYMASGSRKAFHTEHLGYLLAEMQFLPRSFPGAEW